MASASNGIVGAVRGRVLGAAIFVFCLLALQGFSGAFEYDRQEILSGEIWRIWTAHLVHTNVLHILLNIVVALVIYFGFFAKTKLCELLACGFLFSILISLSLLGVLTGLDWYNGLSGLLHAWVIYFSVRLAMEGARMYWLGLGAVWLKVLFEATGVNLDYGNAIGDMNIISDAHLIGAFIGTVAGFIVEVFWSGIGRAAPGRNDVP